MTVGTSFHPRAASELSVFSPVQVSFGFWMDFRRIRRMHCVRSRTVLDQEPNLSCSRVALRGVSSPHEVPKTILAGIPSLRWRGLD
jgi:hypothetical protein